MAVLLYYPLVKPPTEVLHQALLYWDGIATVVPKAPRAYDRAVPDELKELRERQLYTPLSFGEDSVNGLEDPRFPADGPYSSPASRALRQSLRRIAMKPDGLPLPSRPEAFLYYSKISYWLQTELRTLGLAKRWEDNQILIVSKEVQHLVIGTLARELAASRREVSYIPYTDSSQAHTHALDGLNEDLKPAWELELGRMLPTPAPGTPTVDVLTFRDRHADERQRLMRALHHLLGRLRRDYEHPADVLSELRREIDQSVEDYRAAAKSTRIAWVTQSVMVTVALTASVGTMLEPGLAGVLGAVGGYAMNVGSREIRYRARERDGHDFSYLHRITNTLT
ncbi:DUF6236 family protein [Streptomyces cacaoi]|uniref:DUF6236 family protein n=1 Tax=Streptomyces cacaoi TaxID=1898 RepID=UPI0011F15D48|nr:DUF6236 family protein [Streptomyces cacaoi]